MTPRCDPQAEGRYLGEGARRPGRRGGVPGPEGGGVKGHGAFDRPFELQPHIRLSQEQGMMQGEGKTKRKRRKGRKSRGKQACVLEGQLTG